MATHAYGALLDALRATRWGSLVRPRAPLTGAHVARRATPSAEVTEYRPYRQGDEPRRIDWKVLARTDRAFVRLAPDSSVTPTLVLLDASASMVADAPAKWAAACGLVVGLTAVARNAGDPVAFTAVSGAAVTRLPLSARGDALRVVTDAVAALMPGGQGTLATPLERVRAEMRIAIITDLLGDDAETLLTRARSLRVQGREVHLLHLVARHELALDPEVRLARDPEIPSVVRPMRRAEREQYTRAFSAFREQMRDRWRAAGARYHLVVDDQPVADVVRRVARSQR
jgi:uncharacterized protein (DUF58 family)